MEEVTLSPNALKIPEHLRAVIVGGSGCGKSSFLSDLIAHRNQLVPEPGYSKFIWCSPSINDYHASASDVSFKKKLEQVAEPVPIFFYDYILSQEELLEHAETGPVLFVVDDFSAEFFATDVAYQLFTRLATHKSIHSCLAVHSTGGQSKQRGKWYSLIFQNANYLVIFRNLADRLSTSQLSSRIFPYTSPSNHLQRCLNEASTQCDNYTPVIVDANPKNDLNGKYGVRANIFNKHGLPTILFKNPSIYCK